MDGLIRTGASFLGGNNDDERQNQGQQQQGGGGGFDFGSISSLVGHASDHDQSGSGDQQLFTQVAGFLKSSQGGMDGDIDENQVMQSHDKVNNSNEQVHSSEIGNAAALGAIKSVLGGSSGGSGGGGGDFQQKMIGAAMAQAAQLFDQKSSAGAATGDKQDAMQSAGQAVMKLMIKNQVSSVIGGGSSSGLSSLMKLAM